MSSRRPVSAVVLSDVHLGTFGCHARELLAYLHSIEPEVLILNGDIIDIWSFKKSYFPKSHFKVLKRLISMAQKGRYGLTRKVTRPHLTFTENSRKLNKKKENKRYKILEMKKSPLLLLQTF